MSFEPQPVLRGERLLLRPLGVDDFAALFAVASDPLIWEQHPVRDRYTPEVFTTFFREAIDSGGALIAIDHADGRVIGSSRFNGFDPERSAVEIGWTFLARSHWGGAFNGEMKALMLGHAFRFVDNVDFVIGPDNRRSQRAVEKIGGVLVSRRLDDTGLNCLVYRSPGPGAGRKTDGPDGGGRPDRGGGRGGRTARGRPGDEIWAGNGNGGWCRHQPPLS